MKMDHTCKQEMYIINSDHSNHQSHGLHSQLTIVDQQSNQAANQFQQAPQLFSHSDHHQMISPPSYNRGLINTPSRLNYNYEIHDDAWPSSLAQQTGASSQVSDRADCLFKSDTPDYSIGTSLEPLVVYQPDASQSCEHQQADSYSHQPSMPDSIRVDANDFNNNNHNNNNQTNQASQQTNLGAAQTQTQAADCYREQQLFSSSSYYSHNGAPNLTSYNHDADQQYNLSTQYDDLSHNHSHNHNHNNHHNNHHHHHHHQHHQHHNQQHQQHQHHQNQQQQQQEHQQNQQHQLALLDELSEIDQSQSKLGNCYSQDSSTSVHLQHYYEHEGPLPTLDNQQLYQQQQQQQQPQQHPAQAETAASQVELKCSGDDAAAQHPLVFERSSSPDLYQAPRSTYTSLQQLTMNCDNYTNNQVSTTTAALSTSITSQHVAKTRSLKSRRGRPRKKGLRSKNKVNGKLWEFIRDLLLNEHTNPSFIRWERREDGVFKFVQSDKVAKMWGERKQNPKMTYEKLSRAMRYYYKSKVLLPVFGRRLVYKFGPNATGWLPDSGGAVY